MKTKKQVKFEHPKVLLVNSSSSNSFILKSIFGNLQKTFSKENLLKGPQKLRKNKSVNQTVYKCGCVVIQPRIENNCSIEFPLINSKIKSKVLSKLAKSKSLDTISKLKTNKTIQTEKISKQTIDHSNPEKPPKKVKKNKANEKLNLIQKTMKKVNRLKSEYEVLKAEMNDQNSQKKLQKSQSDIKITSKENVRTVQKIRFVEKPIDKVVYTIKKVPKEVTKYKDVVVEVPVHRQVLVFVDPEPTQAQIKYKPVVKTVEKMVKKLNPQDEALKKQIQMKQIECKEIERMISDCLKEIQHLKSFIDIEKHNQQELARAKSAEQLLLQNLKQQANPQLQSQTSIAANLSHLYNIQKPIVSSFEIDENYKINQQTSTIVPSQNVQIIQSQKISQERWSRAPKIMRITSEGKMIVSSGQQRTISADHQTVKITSEVRPLFSDVTPSTEKLQTRIIRKYCKKNCGEVCACMSDLMVITRVDR